MTCTFGKRTGMAAWFWAVSLTLTYSVFSVLALGDSAAAGSPQLWDILIGDGTGTVVGVAPWGWDETWTGSDPVWRPEWVGVYVALYREDGQNWNGPTGLFPSSYYRTPIPPGGTRTWSGFYLWSQNFAPGPDYLIDVGPLGEEGSPPPTGYVGQLVLDQVPASCNYIGPTEFWLDLTAKYWLRLPIPVVADPLAEPVTIFHLTVYTPEPSSLLALTAGIGGLGLGLMRRRRR